MKKEEWQKIIRSACEDAGTYRTFFDPVIDSLAGIMDRRDNAQEKFIASGVRPWLLTRTRAAVRTSLNIRPWWF